MTLKYEEEIDLLALFRILLEGRWVIMLCMLVVTIVGFIAMLSIPRKWTCEAILIPPKQEVLVALNRQVRVLSPLGVNLSITPESLFQNFIRSLDSSSVKRDWIVKNISIKTPARTQEIVMALYLTNGSHLKNNNVRSWEYWTLSYTDSSPDMACTMLKGYIQYVANSIQRETLDNLRQEILGKTAQLQAQIVHERARLESIRQIKLARIRYSLSVARAAGIENPVFSDGQTIRDDPDFPVMLGATALAEKLRIEKSLTDVAQLDEALREKQLTLDALTHARVADVDFKPFSWQVVPEPPFKPDGPGWILVGASCMLLGLIAGCGLVLLRKFLAQQEISEIPYVGVQ